MPVIFRSENRGGGSLRKKGGSGLQASDRPEEGGKKKTELCLHHSIHEVSGRGKKKPTKREGRKRGEREHLRCIE